MFNLDSAAVNALAKLVTALSALVWSVGWKPDQTKHSESRHEPRSSIRIVFVAFVRGATAGLVRVHASLRLQIGKVRSTYP